MFGQSAETGFPVLLISTAGAGLSAGWWRCERSFGWVRVYFAAQGRLGLHRCDQRGDADDVHDALQVVGQQMQGHFGGNLFERLHLEVG